MSKAYTAPRARTPQGEALFELILELLPTFFRLRAAGRRFGAVTAWGGGSWGLVRSLRLDGPQTVPQLARSRPVARQRMQKLADELAGQGLVEFIANPAHRRSSLVRLTAKGMRWHDTVTSRLLAALDGLAEGLAVRDLKSAAETLAELRRRLGVKSHIDN